MAAPPANSQVLGNAPRHLSAGDPTATEEQPSPLDCPDAAPAFASDPCRPPTPAAALGTTSCRRTVLPGSIWKSIPALHVAQANDGADPPKSSNHLEHLYHVRKVFPQKCPRSKYQQDF